jgi:hypothetical protein
MPCRERLWQEWLREWLTSLEQYHKWHKPRKQHRHNSRLCDFIFLEMPARRKPISSSSSSSDSSSDEEYVPPPKPKAKTVKEVLKKVEPPVPRTQGKLAAAKRLEIITNKEKGMEDPDYACTKSATGRWNVRKRKFPIDQSPHLDVTAGQRPLPTPAPKAVEDGPPRAKKADFQLSWINMQEQVNDSLKRDLELLSERYDKLAQKEEKRKKEKKAEKPIPRPMPSFPQQSFPQSYGAPSQPPPPPKLRAGQYRAAPFSINRY